MASTVPPKSVRPTAAAVPSKPYVPEAPELKYARTSRNANVVTAVCAVIVTALVLIGVLLGAAAISKTAAGLNSGSGSTFSNCATQGGTDASC